MTKCINFTKATLDNLPLPDKGQRAYYKDKHIKGLAFAVQGSGAKSFYVIKKISGRSAKIFLGIYPDLSIENARKQASITLGKIALGINPQVEKQRVRSEMTFGELFEQYMTRHSKLHKITWFADQQNITRFCTSWFPKRLSHITRNDVQHLLEYIFANHGLYTSNDAYRRITAIFNKAIEWGWEGTNPTKGIKKYREQARDRFIQPDEMPCILRAINELTNETLKDYLWMLLLTGVRKTNMQHMRREHINWHYNEWRIPITKNGEPIIIPLTDTAMEILRRREKSANGPYVFPRALNNEKPFTYIQEGWVNVKKCAVLHYLELNPTGTTSIMNLRLHDLRRTFASYQAIGGTSLNIIGKSLGHKSSQATLIYARLNMDAVRDSVNRATETMLALQ